MVPRLGREMHILHSREVYILKFREMHIAYNLRRFSSVVFLPQNMARADNERELSRFICIFASAGHLQNGRLKVAGAPVSGQI